VWKSRRAEVGIVARCGAPNKANGCRRRSASVRVRARQPRATGAPAFPQAYQL
jgi:hypothetical protein